MASATVTSTMRSAGWNIELLIKPGDIPFAGVFQPSHHVFMTFRDIVDDLRLGFEIADEEPDVWDDLAFSLMVMWNVSQDDCPAPTFVYGAGLDQFVPAIPEQESGTPDDRPVLQYHIFRHSECSLPSNQSPASHFRAGCAKQIPKPTRRYDPRYLPPKKASSDPRYSAYPLRKTARARTGSTSPKKRPASGSVSPRKNPEQDPSLDEDPLAMVAPLECNISEATARAAMVSFRQSCFTLARRCAVTGLGSLRSWCELPPPGPALQACHIVPQMQYHTYPDEEFDGNERDGMDARSQRRLEEAWKRTWAPENGILLLSHLHECFDMRLFSIHPESLRVRVFTPYDVLLQHQGRVAKIPRNTDRAALRHHYEMCCIENIAAKMPFEEVGVGATSVASTSGVLTPLDVRTKLPRIADSSTREPPSQSNISSGQDIQTLPGGDPAKRTRPADGHDVPHLTGDCSDSKSTSPSPCDGPDLNVDGAGLVLDVMHLRKRKRAHRPLIESELAAQDSYLTPYNCEAFLADVNWELKKVARRRLAPT